MRQYRFSSTATPTGGATISIDRLYRYELFRILPDCDPRRQVTFIMLNPSTADALTDDPTIRRCVSFARRLDCSTMKVVNLYAYRATKPADLFNVDDPIGGPVNDDFILKAVQEASIALAAWGVIGRRDNRDVNVRLMLRKYELRCLGKTKEGHPRHPLYVKGDAPLIYLDDPYQT